VGWRLPPPGDDYEQLPWLAALLLKGIRGPALEDALRAVIVDPPLEVAREEAIKLLRQLEEEP
jgi:hypothetical protein